VGINYFRSGMRTATSCSGKKLPDSCLRGIGPFISPKIGGVAGRDLAGRASQYPELFVRGVKGEAIAASNSGATNMPNLIGKTALVTGASRGIGRASALALAAAGAQVLVHYGRGRG
jgi:hypothetical protein